MNNIFSIIQNTPINPLTYNTSNVSLNQMGKLDRRYPVLLVDTSFWLYYRFFALRNWYRRAYPDITNQPNFNLEHNWLKDEIFITKYKKLFIDNIKSICKKYKTVLTNVVFCIDCPHKDIWRLEENKDYKGTRLDSHLKNEFNAYNLFTHIKKHYLPELQVLYGIKIFFNNKCEADDIIGHFAPYLINNNFNMVFILANDNDYLQICSEKIIMINGNTKNIISTTKAKISNNTIEENDITVNICMDVEVEDTNYGVKYLIKKILLGDSSDNIKCCSIDNGYLDTGIHTNQYKNIYKTLATAIINNSNKYEKLKNILDKIRNGIIKKGDDSQLDFIKNFYNNARLMDFQMLPINLKNELVNKINNFI
jgi:5'-3' exonuclease